MRLLKTPLYLALAVLLSLAQALTPAQAAAFSYPESGAKFKIQIPDGWKTDKGRDSSGDVYTFASPSGAVRVTLKTVRGNADQAVNALVSETEVALKYDVKNVAIAEGSVKGLKMPFVPIQLNNVASATQLNARGVSVQSNQPVFLYFLIFSPDRQLWGWIYGLYPDSAPKQEKEQFFNMVKSIAKA